MKKKRKARGSKAKSKKVMTCKEAAHRLGVNVYTIYRLVREGNLRAMRVGRIYRIAEEDLSNYLRGNFTQKP